MVSGIDHSVGENAENETFLVYFLLAFQLKKKMNGRKLWVQVNCKKKESTTRE